MAEGEGASTLLVVIMIVSLHLLNHHLLMPASLSFCLLEQADDNTLPAALLKRGKNSSGSMRSRKRQEQREKEGMPDVICCEDGHVVWTLLSETCFR